MKKEYNIHIHTSPLIPQVVLTRLTLRGQRCIRHKNIFTSCGSGHKTFSCLYSPWVRGRASSHNGLQSLPHNRDCPQATSSLGDGSGIHIIPREKTYLLTLAYVRHYKYKLHKVNIENKYLLACYMSRLLYSLYEHWSISSHYVFENMAVSVILYSYGSDTSYDISPLSNDG
jgi:hypothetical protein